MTTTEANPLYQPGWMGGFSFTSLIKPLQDRLLQEMEDHYMLATGDAHGGTKLVTPNEKNAVTKVFGVPRFFGYDLVDGSE